MANRSIRPRDTVDVCDVCGRTLLSGEHTEIYLAEGTRRQVCELCTSRAAHNGWIREGAELEVTGRTRQWVHALAENFRSTLGLPS